MSIQRDSRLRADLGLWGSADPTLEKLFGSQDVTEVVWRASLEQLAQGRSAVDIVVSSNPPAILRTTFNIGLAYYPNGPVIQRVQKYVEGSAITIANVPVLPGQEIVLAADTQWGSSLAPRVEVVPVGQGTALEQKRQPTSLSDSLVPLAGLALTAYAAITLIPLFLKRKSK